MEKKREYNEVYGFMPVDIVNKLSQEDRLRMFSNWIEREPTETGWFITKAVIKALGEDFLEYIFKNIIEILDADKDDSEEVIDVFTTTLKGFASDINTLYEYIEDFKEARGSLQVKDMDLLDIPVTEPEEEDPEDDEFGGRLVMVINPEEEKKSKKTKKTTGRTKKKCDIKEEKDPEDQVISEKKSTGRKKKSTVPKKKLTKKLPGRDSKGRFLKK